MRRDTIAQAQSGSGKTGAFAISALNIINIKNEKPQVLILSPTHELATQSLNVVKSIGKYLKVKTQLLVGGTSVEQNKRDLDERPSHIVVGTPGVAAWLERLALLVELLAPLPIYNLVRGGQGLKHVQP